MGPAESIRELVEPLLTAAGLECWDVEVASGVVRVLVDRPGGVDLDTLGTVTQAISAALDDPRRRAGRSLSPGSVEPRVERTLRTPAQYRRFIGALLSVKTVAAVDGERRFRGVLLAADEGGVTLGSETGEAAAPASSPTTTSRRPAPCSCGVPRPSRASTRPAAAPGPCR